MSDWNATKVGVNTFFKSLTAIPYHSLVRNTWTFTEADFWNCQKNRFQKIYMHARNHVPYYRENLNLYPPFEEDSNLLDFLSELPVLSKQTVRDRNTAFWPQKSLFTKTHSTSGTSGTPLKLRASLMEKGFTQALSEEWMIRLVGTRRPKSLNLSGFMTPSKGDALAWYDRIWGHAFLSIYSLNRSNFAEIVDIIHKVKPQVIFGYASAVYQLAKLFQDQPNRYKNDCIAVVTSEVLQPDWHQIMETVLCRKVYNMYGSQEGSHRALQFHGPNLHIEPLTGVIEILDDDNKASTAGEIGKVVVTGLTRYSMPLIRYEIGDAAVSTGYAVTDDELQWPTIGHIEGRSEDLVRMRDGRYIGMLSYSTIKDISGIRESQIVQTGYENFTLYIVPEDDLTSKAEIEAEIYSQFLKRLGIPVNIEFHYVTEIPKSSRGKFKAVVVNFESDA